MSEIEFERLIAEIRENRRNPRLTELQERAAQLFGESRGWKLSPSSFSFSVLAKRKVHNPHEIAPYAPHDIADHPYYYRTADRRAAAIVAHNYNLRESERARAKIVEAVGPGIKVSFLGDVSWWYPGWTTLVLYEPGV